MKKIYRMILALFLLVNFGINAQTVTIGSGAVVGATFSNVGIIYRSSPTSSFDFSDQYLLYTAAEMSAAGIAPGSVINSIAFFKDNAFGTVAGNTVSSWSIYMQNTATTPSTTWSSNNFTTQTSGATLVYSNTSQAIPTTSGWVTLNLTSPFIYTGGSLEIGSTWDCSAFAGGPTNGGFQWRQDNITGQCFGGSSGSATVNMSNQTARPQIQISYVPGTLCTGTPVAGTAVSSAAPVCPSVDFSLSLTGNTVASGLTYQWQSSADDITYIDIAGATNSNLTLSQTADTYYRCVIVCTSSTATSTSSSVFVTTNSFINCYCTSNATSSTNEDIVNVTFGTLNNSSTCSTTGGAGSTQGQYSDYTTLGTVPDLARTATYTMSIGIQNCGTFDTGNSTKVFIDFNQNGLFTDPGEEVYANAGNGTNTGTAQILIPVGAELGNTRMRVVNVRTTLMTSVTPCGTYFNGETEDYLINILPVPSCPQPTSFVLDSTDLTTAGISWDAVTGPTWQVQYDSIGFALGAGTFVNGLTTPSTVLTGLAPQGFYQVYVRAVCAPGDSSIWTGPINFNTYDQAPFMEASNDCPPLGFVDISETGNDLGLTDDSEAGLVLPFPILMQGQLYTNVTVGNNGGLQLGTLSGAIGYGGNFNTMASGTLFPWGDDLDDETGDVFVEVIGTAPNRTLIVQWDSICNFSGSFGAPNVTFQIQFDEATGEIYYVYDDVIFGVPNAADDFGANADIGLSGENQDFTISTNSGTYLMENSCIRFSYVDCPRPTNLITNYVFADEISLSWTAGEFNETNWTVIYGPEGFDPTTGGTSLSVTNPSVIVASLSEKTSYDFYVFADCSPILTSEGLFINLLTLPFCADPSGIALTSGADSLMTTWNWTEYLPIYPVSDFNVQYGTAGFTLGSGTVVSSGVNFSDTTFDANLLAGGVYQVYVQALCGTDSSNYVGPFTTVMPLTNDSICGAELLQVDGTVYVFDNTGATVQTGEGAIAPPATGAQTTDGWINNVITKSTWFKFVAPASGQMRISAVDSDFDGQFAVYDAASCSPIGALTLVAANDNEIDGMSLAPNFTVCGLIPGVEYFLMHDSFGSATEGVYSIKMSPISLDAGLSAAQIEVCVGDTINLFDGISAFQPNGTWEDLNATFQIVNDSLLRTSPLASGVYNFQYKLVDGCASDSALASVAVSPLSTAGDDGTIIICKNEPTNLFAGLTGTIDLGGNWFDPNSAPTSGSSVLTGQLSIPGSYNFQYVVGNGVCPNDTAVVTINVETICDFLTIDENTITGVKVFPNPTNGVLNLQAEDLTEDLSLELFDMNGKVIWTGGMLMNNKDVQIDVTNFERGIYILKLTNSTSTSNYRVVKN